MAINNEMYHDFEWWDEEDPIHILRSGLNPVRFPYFREILSESKVRPAGKRVLDVGCGGGFLSEEFAKLGFEVHGIDPSLPTLEKAKKHAMLSKLEIKYAHGAGEKLEYPDSHFDVVVCCDVLEHVKDLDRVISEISRVLKPGGLFFYDTINRTFISKLVMIKLAQEWKATAFVPPDLHDWKMFIKPKELEAYFSKYRLRNKSTIGIEPGVNPLMLIPLMIKRANGKMKNSDFGRQVTFRRTRNLDIAYMGYCTK
jgi:2-polyprenyl-6-hydroxyphenyl methylase/3-demethylubiquinone-9 3-methyltransferase